MNTIDINDLCLKYEEELKQNTKGCIIRPSVAVIVVGNNDKTNMFVDLKREACNKIGIYFRIYEFDENTTELTIINKIKELNNDDYVNGIMVELPLPEKYNAKKIINTIQNSKDVDGMTDINIGRYISKRKTIVPSISLSVLNILKKNEIEIEGKNVVIVGRGKTAGRPLASAMINEDATVTICNSKTTNLKKYTENADILISATGVKNLITEDMVKDNAIIVSVGFELEDGKVIDDIDLEKFAKKASLVISANEIIKMGITMFLKNSLFCYNKNK